MPTRCCTAHHRATTITLLFSLLLLLTASVSRSQDSVLLYDNSSAYDIFKYNEQDQLVPAVLVSDVARQTNLGAYSVLLDEICSAGEK